MAKTTKQQNGNASIMSEYIRTSATELLITDLIDEKCFKPAEWTTGVQAVSGPFAPEICAKHFGRYTGNAHPALVQYANMYGFWRKHIPNVAEMFEGCMKYAEPVVLTILNDISPRNATPRHIRDDTSCIMQLLTATKEQIKKEMNALPVAYQSQTHKLNRISWVQTYAHAAMIQTMQNATNYALYYTKSAGEAEYIDTSLLPDSFESWHERHLTFSGVYAMINDDGISDSYCVMHLVFDHDKPDGKAQVYLQIRVVPSTNFPTYAMDYCFCDKDKKNCGFAIGHTRRQERMPLDAPAKTKGMKRIYAAINQLLCIAKQTGDGVLKPQSQLKDGVYYTADELYNNDIPDAERTVIGVHAKKVVWDYPVEALAVDKDKPTCCWLTVNDIKQLYSEEAGVAMTEKEVIQRLLTQVNAREEVLCDWVNFGKRMDAKMK